MLLQRVLITGMIFLGSCTTKPIALNGSDQAPSKQALDQKFVEQFRLQALKIKSDFSASGKVDYHKLKSSQLFTEFVIMSEKLASFNLDTLATKEQKLAFWINIYNALTIHGIVRFEIVKSVRDVSGFFEKCAYNIGGQVFSLNDIENGVLRANRRGPYQFSKVFSSDDVRLKHALTESDFDPRIHFALNCGSASCPPFAFYKADDIDNQLNIATRGFINSDSIISTSKPQTVQISKIFDWYEVDFAPTIQSFIINYADDELSNALKSGSKILFNEYDWGLNTVK